MFNIIHIYMDTSENAVCTSKVSIQEKHYKHILQHMFIVLQYINGSY